MSIFNRLRLPWITALLETAPAESAPGSGWWGHLTRFMAVQVLVQALGMVAGFVFVRTLDKTDYALYTLANGTIFAFFALLDCGIGDTAAAIGGRAWTDSAHMGQVLASAASVRRRLMSFMFVPLAAFECWLLLHNGAGAGETAFLLLAAWLAADRQLSTELLRVVLRLRSSIRDIQYLDLMSALLRASLAIALIAFLDLNMAVLIVLAGAAVAYLLTRRRVARAIDMGAPANSAMEAEIRTGVRRRWLYEVVGVFYGQLSLLLLGLFGGTVAVADVGALGRIAALFAVLEAVARSIVLPRFARCQEPRELRRIYLAALGFCTAVAVLPALAAWLIPVPLLWILGANYQSLSHELLLVALGAGTGFLGSVTWGLNSIRAWVIHSWIIVPLDLGVVLILMAVIGVASMQQLLWVTIVGNFALMLVNVAAALIFSKGFTRA